MCVKSRNVTTVPILHNGTNLAVSLLNAQLPHSSDLKTVGIQTMQMAILFLSAHFPSNPMCRIDLLSSATMVLPTSQQGQTIMAAGRAKMGIKDSQGIAFCVVSLAIGRQNVLPVAGYNLCLRRCLSSKSHQKTKHWAVCRCMWAGKLICWVAC